MMIHRQVKADHHIEHYYEPWQRVRKRRDPERPVWTPVNSLAPGSGYGGAYLAEVDSDVADEAANQHSNEAREGVKEGKVRRKLIRDQPTNEGAETACDGRRVGFAEHEISPVG